MNTLKVARAEGMVQRKLELIETAARDQHETNSFRWLAKEALELHRLMKYLMELKGGDHGGK